MDVDDLAQAQAAVSTLLADLDAADWGAPTPCEEWDVAGVVRHLIAGERAFTTSLGGEAYDLAAITADVSRLADGDLPAAYDDGARRLRLALGTATGGPFPTGIGPMSTPHVAELRTIEALTHGWDLARATRRPLDVQDPVAERAIAHSLALMERLPAGRTPFGPARPVAAERPAIDRLAGLLGRPAS